MDTVFFKIRNSSLYKSVIQVAMFEFSLRAITEKKKRKNRSILISVCYVSESSFCKFFIWLCSCKKRCAIGSGQNGANFTYLDLIVYKKTEQKQKKSWLNSAKARNGEASLQGQAYCTL